jgi:predicted ribosome quality control (RQC) complex YloA/Tae2 family protein
MEEKKIPADPVAPPSPLKVKNWCSWLQQAFMGRKVHTAVITEDFVLTVVFDNKQALSLSTHPQVPLIAFFDQNPPFLDDPLVLKENLGGLSLSDIEAIEGEPILKLTFSGPLDRRLVWEGFKRSSNVLLLDAEDKILWALRSFKGEFRKGLPLEIWQPPPFRPEKEMIEDGVSPEAEIKVSNPESLFQYLLEKAKARRKKNDVSKLKGLERKKEALSGETSEAEKWISLEFKAKTLLSAEGLRRRGETEIKVVDYSVDPPAEEILSLNPSLTVLENAEKMFKLTKKGRERLKLFPARIREIDAKIAELQSEISKIDEASDLVSLYPSKAEKKKQVEKKTVISKLPKNVAAIDLPREFKGFAGKNANGNDYVSFRIGKGEDFWFHVSDYKGSHVVVRNPSRLEELPLETELAAARYAAFHSSAPKGSAVDVTTTKVKFLSRVRKTPGAVYVSRSRKRFVDLNDNG